MTLDNYRRFHAEESEHWPPPVYHNVVAIAYTPGSWRK